jgi:hypothetical protein
VFVFSHLVLFIFIIYVLLWSLKFNFAHPTYDTKILKTKKPQKAQLKRLRIPISTLPR